MKKLFVSAGLVALGAAALPSATASSTSPDYWNVSGTLRGFYDDNYNIGTSRGSGGVEVSPSVSFHVPLQQTDIGIKYTYGAYYYQDRQDLGLNAFDQTHQVDLWLDHAINEQWHLNLTDSFASGQEPDLSQNAGTPLAVQYRVNGDNISNHGSVALTTDWTRLFSTVLTYDNSVYDYDNSGAQTGAAAGAPIFSGIPTFLTHAGLAGWQMFNNGTGPSLSGILDRVEESASLDLKWHLQPETTVFVGYQFSWVNYTGNEPIAIVNYDNSPIPPIIVLPYTAAHPQSLIYMSSARDSYTHYGYVGIEHQFIANLSGMIRGGASYTDNYNDPLNSSTSWNPYADVSLQYTYLPGSYVQVGFTQDISASDQVQPDSNGHLTQYNQNSVVYLDVNHKFTPKLSASAIGRVQFTTFQGGAANSDNETDYSLGLNLSYQINQHFSVDAGYNYDNLQTSGQTVADVGYTRNRVYLGVSAKY